jgi:hypothetical protein
MSLEALPSAPFLVVPWTPFVFTAPWQNLGSPYDAGQFARDSLGIIYLRGVVQWNSASAPGNTVIATLPAGSRPSSQFVLMVGGSGGPSRVDVIPASGQIQYTGALTGGATIGNGGWLMLDHWLSII